MPGADRLAKQAFPRPFYDLRAFLHRTRSSRLRSALAFRCSEDSARPFHNNKSPRPAATTVFPPDLLGLSKAPHHCTAVSPYPCILRVADHLAFAVRAGSLSFPMNVTISLPHCCLASTATVSRPRYDSSGAIVARLPQSRLPCGILPPGRVGSDEHWHGAVLDRYRVA